MIGINAPAKPSLLRITSTITPTPAILCSPIAKRRRAVCLSKSLQSSPPSLPPAWTWTCHQCHSTFRLGATRRCLHDGHRFCAGATIDPRTGRMRKHKACGSTFDYSGWELYNRWREEMSQTSPSPRSPDNLARTNRAFDRRRRSLLLGLSTREGSSPFSDTENGSPVSSKNCERYCNFPSECRWNPDTLKARKAKRAGRKSQTKSGRSLLSPQSAGAIDPSLLSGSPVSPLSPSPTSPKKQTGDFRAPVLDFAAFKARLDKAHARRQLRSQQQQEAGDEQYGNTNDYNGCSGSHSYTFASRQELDQSQDRDMRLPELEFGASILMDVDAISPRDELPANKEIQVAIRPDQMHVDTEEEQDRFRPKRMNNESSFSDSDPDSDSDSSSETREVDFGGQGTNASGFAIAYADVDALNNALPQRSNRGVLPSILEDDVVEFEGDDFQPGGMIKKQKKRNGRSSLFSLEENSSSADLTSSVVTSGRKSSNTNNATGDGWNWSVGGLGSQKAATGTDLAGLIGVPEEAWIAMLLDVGEDSEDSEDSKDSEESIGNFGDGNGADADLMQL